MPHPFHRRRAFTLIELICVVAVIVILTALLFTTARAVLDRANAAKCVSNLKQVGSALFNYAAENNGLIPPRNLGINRADASSMPPANLRPWPARLLNLGYIDNEDAFYCPSFFPRSSREAGKNIRTSASETYGIRMWVPPGQSWTPQNIEEEKPLASIRNPAEFFLVADSVWLSWHSQGYGLTPGREDMNVHLRHQNHANALFADGHVEAKPAEYFTTIHEPGKQIDYVGGSNRKFSVIVGPDLPK